MATVTELINQSLGLVGAFSIGATPSAEDTQLAKFNLERLIETFTEDSLVIPYETTDTLTTVAGTASYTIGEDGTPDVDTVRPDIINRAILTDGTTDYRLEIIALDRYDELSQKSTQNRPSSLAYDPTLPNATIYLYQTPGAVYSIALKSKKTFAAPVELSYDLTTNYSIPASYFPLLMYRLAYMIAPHYNMDPGVMTFIQNQGQYYENKIKHRNASRQIREVDIPYRGIGQRGTYGDIFNL